MSFKQGLVRARSHLIFLTGLVTAFGLVGWLEGLSVGNANTPEAMIEISTEVNIAPTRALTAQELAWAKTAWKYFQNNTIPETGLVNSVDKYNASTLWDTSSYLMAVIAAQRLGIIDQTEFDARIFKALDSRKCRCLKENCRISPTTPFPCKWWITTISRVKRESVGRQSTSGVCLCRSMCWRGITRNTRLPLKK